MTKMKKNYKTFADLKKNESDYSSEPEETVELGM